MGCCYCVQIINWDVLKRLENLVNGRIRFGGDRLKNNDAFSLVEVSSQKASKYRSSISASDLILFLPLLGKASGVSAQNFRITFNRGSQYFRCFATMAFARTRRSSSGGGAITFFTKIKKTAGDAQRPQRIAKIGGGDRNRTDE